MATILVVDDDERMLSLVRRILEKSHTVVTTSDAAAVATMNLSSYDLLMLDVMMPEMDGFTLMRHIRMTFDGPILFLTAKTAEEDLVVGLGLGADDYITKPFGAASLRARVDAHLRRENREKTNAFSQGGVTFHLSAKEAAVDGVALPFTKSEYDICEFLALHHGQTFSKEQIYEAVFGYDRESEASVIASHVKNVRAKLQKRGLAPIKTVWGVGYQWL